MELTAGEITAVVSPHLLWPFRALGAAFQAPHREWMRAAEARPFSIHALPPLLLSGGCCVQSSGQRSLTVCHTQRWRTKMAGVGGGGVYTQRFCDRNLWGGGGGTHRAKIL